MSRPNLSKWATFAAIAMILAGCGTSNGLLAARTNLAVNASADPNGPFGHGGKGGRDGGNRGFIPGVNLADLNLTADQQTQLKAVMDKYKPAAPAARPSDDPRQALQAAVLADTVDDAALRAAIAALEANRPAAPKADHTAMLTDIRAILTADQRATIVAKLQTATAPSPRPQPSGDPRAAKLASLNLTTAQQAALDALDAARKPNQADFATRNAAMITFWQTGDASGLAAPTPPAFPVEPFVAAVELLDATQRKALFGQGGRGFGGPGRDHGGPDGDRDGFRGQGAPQAPASPAA